MTTYRIRLRTARVVGVVMLPGIHTLQSARAIARQWSVELGPQWDVDVLDPDGVTALTIRGAGVPV